MNRKEMAYIASSSHCDPSTSSNLSTEYYFLCRRTEISTLVVAGICKAKNYANAKTDAPDGAPAPITLSVGRYPASCKSERRNYVSVSHAINIKCCKHCRLVLLLIISAIKG